MMLFSLSCTCSPCKMFAGWAWEVHKNQHKAQGPMPVGSGGWHKNQHTAQELIQWVDTVPAGKGNNTGDGGSHSLVDIQVGG